MADLTTHRETRIEDAMWWLVGDVIPITLCSYDTLCYAMLCRLMHGILFVSKRYADCQRPSIST